MSEYDEVMKEYKMVLKKYKRFQDEYESNPQDRGVIAKTVRSYRTREQEYRSKLHGLREKLYKLSGEN